MTRNNSIALLVGAAALIAAALAAAGCGGSGGSHAKTPAPPKNANGKSATVGVANEDVGKILVDSHGRTLYLFERDSGTKSTCAGACAVEWPPLRASGKPTVGGGANASVVATIARSDGKPQVTYNGHPLYLFSADQKAGDTNGQGVNAFGGLWYVLSSSGVENTTPTGSGGGFGY
jgi:predicted lipoprotein with Yx(FWY)xxD motif